jgi:hypothetical protein
MFKTTLADAVYLESTLIACHDNIVGSWRRFRMWRRIQVETKIVSPLPSLHARFRSNVEVKFRRAVKVSLRLVRERWMRSDSGVGELRMHRAPTIRCGRGRARNLRRLVVLLHLEAKGPSHSVRRRRRCGLWAHELSLRCPSLVKTTRVFVG